MIKNLVQGSQEREVSERPHACSIKCSRIRIHLPQIHLSFAQPKSPNLEIPSIEFSHNDDSDEPDNTRQGVDGDGNPPGGRDVHFRHLQRAGSEKGRESGRQSELRDDVEVIVVQEERDRDVQSVQASQHARKKNLSDLSNS